MAFVLELSAVNSPPSETREIAVRPSAEADVSAMLAIYSHHIRHGLASGFDPEPLQDEDIKRRRKNMLRRRLPHLVAERDGKVVGYAYAVPFRKRLSTCSFFLFDFLRGLPEKQIGADGRAKNRNNRFPGSFT